MGYAWHARVRMTPLNGPVETLDLATVFTIGGAVATVLTQVELTYKELIQNRDTVNRSSRPLNEGFRPTVRLTFQTSDMTTHYATINKVQNRMRNPLWTVELALDTSGTIYRVMVLKRALSLEPFKKKTVAGAKMSLEMEARDPILDIPDIAGGAAW